MGNIFNFDTDDLVKDSEFAHDLDCLVYIAMTRGESVELISDTLRVKAKHVLSPNHTELVGNPARYRASKTVRNPGVHN